MSEDGPRSSPLFDDVPHETLDRLAIFAAELKRWQAVTNLVGPKTLSEIWVRHFADSLQLVPLASDRICVDLGSGAGFPGLVLAIADPGRTVHLVESDSRRCAFLRHVARVTGATVQVHDGRAEQVLGRLVPRPTLVTARAVAPLPVLLGWAGNLLIEGATGLFPKGRDHMRELTAARVSWTFSCDVIPSRVDPQGAILRVRDLGLGPSVKAGGTS